MHQSLFEEKKWLNEKCDQLCVLGLQHGRRLIDFAIQVAYVTSCEKKKQQKSILYFSYVTIFMHGLVI